MLRLIINAPHNSPSRPIPAELSKIPIKKIFYYRIACFYKKLTGINDPFFSTLVALTSHQTPYLMRKANAFVLPRHWQNYGFSILRYIIPKYWKQCPSTTSTLCLFTPFTHRLFKVELYSAFLSYQNCAGKHIHVALLINDCEAQIFIVQSLLHNTLDNTDSRLYLCQPIFVIVSNMQGWRN